LGFGWRLKGLWQSIILSNSGFHATFSIVMKNKTAYHLHQISNTTINNIHIYGNNTIMQDSVTVIMINEPVSNVPVT
jgi:hypothetical protein